jgi:O-antigen ligase
VLLALAASNKRLAEVARVSVRIDWLGSVVALALAVPLLIAGRRIPRSPALWWFLAFVGAQTLAALVNAGVWPRGFRFLVIYFCALAYVVALVLLIRDRATARFALGVLLVIAVAVSVLGIGTLFIRNILALPTGTFNDLGEESSYSRARGLLTEPNLFASFVLVPYAVALWRWPGEPRWRWPRALLVGVLTAALVCALTRVAWGLACILIVLWVWRMRPTRRQVGFVAACIVATFVVLLATEWPMTGGDLRRGGVYRQILKPAVSLGDSAVEGRIMEIETGTASIVKQPLIGHGPGSSNRLEQYVSEWQILRRRGWIANGTVFVLHDSGVIGLLALAGTVVAAALGARAAAPRFGDPATRHDHEAVAIGLAAVLVAWQSTHGLWQMYGYVAFGLLLALQALADREAASVAARPSASAG